MYTCSLEAQRMKHDGENRKVFVVLTTAIKNRQVNSQHYTTNTTTLTVSPLLLQCTRYPVNCQTQIFPLAVSNMTIAVKVGLLSGKTATVKVGFDEDVETLQDRAQTALGVGKGRLVDSFGSVLDAHAPIKNSNLKNGDSLTLHISPVQVCGTAYAFATVLGDGSVVTWGLAGRGGDSSAVQEQLRNVQQIQATSTAFAAILGDGRVVTWGDTLYGGDSSAVQDQLKNVQQIQATHHAFAAILRDGSVVTWGDSSQGGDCSAVQDQLKNVQQIRASDGAFAAILSNGSVVTWGDANRGANSSAVQEQLKNVQHIQGAECAFAAIRSDESVVTWGHCSSGCDTSAVKEQLRNVKQIQASYRAFAAILADRSVVT